MRQFKFQPEFDRQPVIVSACRTAVGRAFGSLRSLRVEELAASAIRHTVSPARVDPASIDDVLLGNATGPGGNIGRLSSLTGGLPLTVPGVTIDRQCGAGLEAIIMAARLVQAGAGDRFIAGGAESVSTAPWRVERPRKDSDLPRFYGRARFSPDVIGDPEMGVAAENVALECGISRARQDAFALRSHQRAIAAQDRDAFSDEIVSLSIGNAQFDVDECPRRSTSLEALSALKPAFVKDGTVTAGNSCPLNDGASVVLVMSRAAALAAGWTQGLVFIDAATAGVDPKLLGLGPVASTQRLEARQPELSREAVRLIEFNEAFAAQVLGSLDRLEIDEGRVNQDGGALALGHPFGASGAILVTRLFWQAMKTGQDGALAMAMLGIGGGMGLTALFEWAERL